MEHERASTPFDAVIVGGGHNGLTRGRLLQRNAATCVRGSRIGGAA